MLDETNVSCICTISKAFVNWRHELVKAILLFMFLFDILFIYFNGHYMLLRHGPSGPFVHSFLVLLFILPKRRQSGQIKKRKYHQNGKRGEKNKNKNNNAKE